MSSTYIFHLPDIEEGLSEAEIVSWEKNVGDVVELNEVVVTALTDKATVDFPAPYSGRLIKIYVQEKETIQVGQPLFEIETNAVVSSPHTRVENSAPQLSSTCRPYEERQPCSEKKGVLALPSTRQLAKELCVDIDMIKGTGSEGRVIDEDVQKYCLENSSKVDEQETIKQTPSLLCGFKRSMIRRMNESNKIPHFSYFEQVDATKLIEMRNLWKASGFAQITFMPFFLKGLSMTMERFPILNSTIIDENKIVYHERQNIAVAFNSSQGLLVPVLKDIQGLSFEELIAAYQSFILRARENKLKPEDHREATMTLSNFGALGNGLWTTPRITSPQVAILAVSKIQKQPYVREGELAAVDVLNLSWSFDHRIIDGQEAAAISSYYRSIMENSLFLR